MRNNEYISKIVDLIRSNYEGLAINKPHSRELSIGLLKVNNQKYRFFSTPDKVPSPKNVNNGNYIAIPTIDDRYQCL